MPGERDCANPFNGIERQQISLERSDDKVQTRNPFNGIERCRSVLARRSCKGVGNPFNGIERGKEEIEGLRAKS